MSFFNKKEDVIDIQLTQYGKHLLSKGKFKPAYYAFFDDDVVYDSSYAGLTETQNDIQQRIDDTPRLKAQYNFSERKSSLIAQVLTPFAGPESSPETSEQYFSLTSALGTSGIGSLTAPAWQIRFFKGEIESFLDTGDAYTIDAEERILETPQITLKDIEYKTQVFKGQPSAEALDTPTGENLLAEDNDSFGIVFPDSSYISIKEDYALIKVDELGVDFERENFDIEVFKIGEGDTLIPLKFAKKPETIKDGLLLDLSEDDVPPIELDKTFVEYWFNILCDSEIDDKYLRYVENKTPRGGIFVQDDSVTPVQTPAETVETPITEEEDEC